MTIEFIDLKKTKLAETESREQLALDVLMGLTSSPKELPPMHFYDDIGSRLFQKIMSSKDYYITRCETEIFQKYSRDIIDTLDQEDLQVVELGAGDGSKTKLLIQAILDRKVNVSYFPIDISKKALEDLVEGFAPTFDNLTMRCIEGEYFQGLRWMGSQKKAKSLVLFLGSNIGNFAKPKAAVFLKTLWNVLGDGDFVLLGADLKKDINKMLWAYNDREGYTKQFNLNLLERINKELDADIDVRKFQHYGTYNIERGAMESFLVSLENQTIRVGELNRDFSFKAFEAIHVESSYKYLLSEMEELVEHAGFKLVQIFKDDEGYFADFLLKAIKD